MNISLAQSKLKMIYTHRGQTITLTPDDLFSHLTDFIPPILLNATTWFFSLVILFFHICFSSCKKLCNFGVAFYLNLPSFETLFDENLHIYKIRSSFTNGHRSSQYNLQIDSPNFVSSAEKIISESSESNALSTAGPLVTHYDKKMSSKPF